VKTLEAKTNHTAARITRRESVVLAPPRGSEAATFTGSVLSRRGQVAFDASEHLVQPIGRVEQHLDQRVERCEMIILEVLSVVVFPMLFGQLPRLDQFDVSLVELSAINGEFGNSHGDDVG